MNWFRLSGEFDFSLYPLNRRLHEVVYPCQVMLTNLEVSIRFLAPDPAVDEKTIIKIAKSFEMLANG